MIATEPYIPSPVRPPTTRQLDVLDAIRLFIQINHYPPTTRELGEILGLASASTVQNHLVQLERRGIISRHLHEARTIVVLEDWQ